MKKKMLFSLIGLMMVSPIIANAKEKKVYDTMAELANKKTVSSFTSKIDPGVYEITEGDNKYFFYSGEVDTNNAILDGVCWQLVRTTDTNGVKMIYAGEANDGKCKNDGSDLSIGRANYINNLYYIGYNQKAEVFYSQKIKNTVNNWFKDNYIESQEYLEDTTWCSSYEYVASDKGGANKPFYQNGFVPNISCSNGEKYNTKSGRLTYPVAIFSADEYVLTNSYNNTGFISNALEIWSMTFDGWKYDYSDMYDTKVISNKKVNFGSNEELYIRPGVSIKNTVVIKKGDGTPTNPYILGWPEKEPEPTPTPEKKEDPKPTPKEEVKADPKVEEEVSENPPTGGVVPIIVLATIGGAVVYMMKINKKNNVLK